MVPRRSLTVVGSTLAALVLAACGSQLDPDQVARTGQVGSVVGEGTAAGDPLTGTGTGTDGGSVVPGTDSSGTGTSSGTGGTSTGTGGTGTGAGTGSTGEGPDGAPPVPDSEAGDCAGFKNGPGITDKTITIGNASDISGPVPGLFEASRLATQAYVAYFNATSDICGRKLELKLYDSRSDAGANQQAYSDACNSVFAMVGSMSAFDSGGSAESQACGLLDLRSASTTKDRLDCTTCFGTQSASSQEFENAVPDFMIDNYDGGQKAAMFYINAGAASENGKTQVALMEKRGMDFIYEQPVETSEFNYTPYVQQLKDRGVETVQFIAAGSYFIRLRQAMAQQDYEPRLYLLDPTAYTPRFVEEGGDVVDGTVVFMNFTPFEEAARSPETQLYLSWLEQVKPGAIPDFFGVFSWSAAKLFVEQAIRLGGKLSRSTMVDAISKVDGWEADGMHAPQRVGPERVGDCWRFIELQDGVWRPIGGTKYTCNGVTTF